MRIMDFAVLVGGKESGVLAEHQAALVNLDHKLFWSLK